MPAKSSEAQGERERQLAIARALVADSGSITIEYFDTCSDRFSTWSRRPKARRILTALSNPARRFDAIVVGDTRMVMSAHDFDALAHQCRVHGVQLWCPEISGRFNPLRSEHQQIMRRFLWKSTLDSSAHAFGVLACGPPPPVGEGHTANAPAQPTLLGNGWVQDSAQEPRSIPNSKPLAGMRTKPPTAETAAEVSESEIAWDAVLTDDGWHLSPAASPDHGARLVVRVSAAEAVPTAGLLDKLQRANSTGANVIRLIVTADGD